MVLWLAIALPVVIALQRCSEDDFEFTYTNCDENGERWRVAVPRHAASCENLPPPQKGLNCSFSCQAGHYLDLETQGCRPCNPGSFSLGGGVRFEDFVTLPAGFSIENFDANADLYFSSGGREKENVCEKETGWLVRDGELMYVPSSCVSRLSFSANLVRPGYVEFTYRMPRNNRALSLQVDVRNEQCQSYSDAARSMLARYSKNKGKEEEERNGDWRRRRVDMRTGTNVISWTISNSLGFQSSQEPVHFARVDVNGLAFTRECTACPPGTSSTAAAAECSPCQAGFFAPKGSSKCGVCPQSQYSGPKAERCINRPPCRQSDYYPVREPCTNGSSRVTYKKVLPAVCRDDLPEAASLPAPGPWTPCPKCNPGMAKNSQGLCDFCPLHHFSDGNECKRCPVDTVPNYGLQYILWDVMPPKLTSRCEYISDDVSMSCDIGNAWIPSGSALISAPSLQRGIAFELVLSIDEGFFNPLAPKSMSAVPVAQVTIVFETSCSDPSCVIYFIEDTTVGNAKESFFHFLAAFNGTQSKRVWSHTVTQNTPAKFMVAFLRSQVSSGEDSITDEARIYAINVTNVGHRKAQGGGASECLACPHTQGGETCVPCPPGNYMHPKTQLCIPCPPNTAINASSSRIGEESCVKCGVGLFSKDGVECKTDGKFSIEGNGNTTFHYDFSPWIERNWTLAGVRVFSREGSAYYHQFKVSLFAPTVKCEEEFDGADIVGFLDTSREKVIGTACRLTALPGATRNHSKIALVSPLLLAKSLRAVTQSTDYQGWHLSKELLEYESLDKASLPMDIFLWYEPIASTGVTCPNGIVFVAVARCQPAKKQPEMRLPKGCPDGTCDGCTYAVIIETAQACPVCGASDYQTIKGECVGGKQTIHSIPQKHCVISGKAAESHDEPCSVLTSQQKFLLATLAVSLFSAIATLFLMCRRNRRLEYKYTRLIESRTGELPVAESCGLDEDEEDEMTDRVIFSKGKRSRPPANRGGSERDNAAFISLDNED
ncbi:unnamed protein product [Caenorhabditis auriculariae]|uniref:Tyrosine-protein kinase ephrin type A/B receptor-like domain-containing protein n=1 Tax=Caenorhabditis auriculariae TaxID=2777116 RepID=A0A8S1H955_9PELO|nr:unnamed protein product [Caenorhabditis auriculariae]